MMKLLYAFGLTFTFYASLGQRKADQQKIASFKNDLLDKVEMYKPDTLVTGSLMLVREKYPNVRLIKTITRGNEIVLYEYYYNGTTKIESTSTYDRSGNPRGIVKTYSNEGVLAYAQDYDNGKWIVYDKKAYPFYEQQHTMKVKADSLISKMYGHKFWLNNTIWNVSGSYIYNETESGYWTSNLKSRPTKFLFRYDVKLDKEHRYNERIEFELTDGGVFIPNEYEEIYGFEDMPLSRRREFRLTYAQAIAQARQLGLQENDSSKATGTLRWENFRKPALINGCFRFYVTIKTKTIENIVPNGRSSRTTKYEVYSFNPWTGSFVEKKKNEVDIFLGRNEWQQHRSDPGRGLDGN